MSDPVLPPVEAEGVLMRRANLFVLGLVVAGGFWVVEAGIHTWIFRDGPGFLGHLFPADANEWWMRALASVLIVSMGGYAELVARVLKRREAEQRVLEGRLQDALAMVLSGHIPICARCKAIREKDQWMPVEEYVAGHSYAQFSHGLCPQCLRQYIHDDRAAG